jgi:hypothetical protein
MANNGCKISTRRERERGLLESQQTPADNRHLPGLPISKLGIPALVGIAIVGLDDSSKSTGKRDGGRGFCVRQPRVARASSRSSFFSAAADKMTGPPFPLSRSSDTDVARCCLADPDRATGL